MAFATAFKEGRRGRASYTPTRTRQFILGAVAGFGGRRWEDDEEREEKKFDAHDVKEKEVSVVTVSMFPSGVPIRKFG
jgi:hypothetical protein